MLTCKPVTLQVVMRYQSSGLEALCAGRESFGVVVTSVEVLVVEVVVVVAVVVEETAVDADSSNAA